MKYLNRNGTDGTNGIEDDPLSSKVIGLAIEIHKEIGPGYSESIYHRAMEIDPAEAGISFVTEAPLAVKYKERILGSFVADMIVEERLLLEFKALENLPLISEIQVVHVSQGVTTRRRPDSQFRNRDASDQTKISSSATDRSGYSPSRSLILS